MKTIKRSLENVFQSKLNDPKAIIVLGARQVGKTTLFRSLMTNINDVLWLNGDEPDVRATLSNSNSSNLRKFIGGYKFLVIDEAQRIENIGLTIKLIVDNIPSVKVIATGSSSFELANHINEPLTGRKWEFQLYPLSTNELVNHHGYLEESRLLEHRLVYGMYPDVINESSGREMDILLQLSDSYLYRDLLVWENIYKPKQLEKLVQSLAFQVGQLISINELANQTGLDNKTVVRYIDLLKKSYVIFELTSFSRNLRNEIKKQSKIYFFDNGIRNAVIRQFNPLKLRNDVGALWENFIVSERMKLNGYFHRMRQNYFWRNHAQQEVDLVETESTDIRAFEIKWNPKSKAKFSKSFTLEYNPVETTVISPENYMEFLLQE
jgi:predicted AAA+ superfamily ATPase